MTARRPTALPDIADDRIRAETGRGWVEWRAAIDGAGLCDARHTAIARWLSDECGVEGWWAQAVTVGYERLTGLRLPGQMADGTFTANVSRTLDVAADRVRTLLAESRAELFAGMAAELRSRPGSKSVRIAFPEGVVLFSLAPATGGRTTVAIAHEKLPSAEAVGTWKAYWREWLDALADR